MQAWLASVVVAVLTNLGSSVGAWILKFIVSRKQKAETAETIDARLARFKQAYLEAFDGKKVTPEQKAALKAAIAEFVRNPDNRGL